MLRRLIQLLQDDVADAYTFPLRSEAFAIEGLPATARRLVIEKASGETLIAVWNETPAWQAIREVDVERPKPNWS